MSALIEFHSKNKLLFMAYGQVKLKSLGQIVANKDKKDVEEVFSRYSEKLYELLQNNPDFHKWINVLMHGFGFISHELNKEEKKFFLEKIEEYRDERIPRSTIKSILHSWAIRFDNQHLLTQTLLNPFPNDLVEITDSGKGRKL